MAAPSSGELSFLGFARERQYNNYSSGTISGQISAADLWGGTNSCGSSGTNFRDANSGQSYTTYPKPSCTQNLGDTNENQAYPAFTPKNLSWNQWYNYDQDRGGTWFALSNFPICRAWGASFGQTNSAVFTLGSVRGCAPGTGNVAPERIAGDCKSSTTIEWNGSSFSTGGSAPISGNYGVGGDSSTSGVVVRPNVQTSVGNPVTCGKAFTYNGTSFTLRCLCCNVAGSNYMQTAQNPSSGQMFTGFGFHVAIQVGGRNSGCRAFMYFPNGTCISHCNLGNMNAACRILGGVIGMYKASPTVTMGGYGMATNPRCDTEKYNGSSWSTSGNMSVGRFGFMTGANGGSRKCVWGGMSTKAYSGATATHEDFNGTSWSTRTSHPSAIVGAFHAGSANDQVCYFFKDCAISAGGSVYATPTPTAGAGYAINKAYSFCENSRRYSNIFNPSP